MTKQWIGTPPEKCELCESLIEDAFVDGKTQFGYWAYMCPICHNTYGRGLGTGFGQKYQKTPQGWIKLDG